MPSDLGKFSLHYDMQCTKTIFTLTMSLLKKEVPDESCWQVLRVWFIHHHHHWDLTCECMVLWFTTSIPIKFMVCFGHRELTNLVSVIHSPSPPPPIQINGMLWILGVNKSFEWFCDSPPPLNPRCKLLFSLGLKYHTLINWLKNGTWLSHIFLCSYDFLIQIYIYIQILLSVVPATEIILYFLEAVHIHQLYIVHACIKPRSCPLKLIG